MGAKILVSSKCAGHSVRDSKAKDLSKSAVKFTSHILLPYMHNSLTRHTWHKLDEIIFRALAYLLLRDEICVEGFLTGFDSRGESAEPGTCDRGADNQTDQ